MEEFFPAEQILDYYVLCDFFKKYDIHWYHSRNIYCEEHYIEPKKKGPVTKIYMPKFFHARAHILRAEYCTGSAKYKNYATANKILGKNLPPKKLRKLYSLE